MILHNPIRRESLTSFLYHHKGQIIELKEDGGTFRIKGNLIDLAEIDICGRILFEGYIAMDLDELLVHMTIHNDFLGIQVTIHKNCSDSPLMITKNVPYEKLRVLSFEDF